MTNSQKKKCAEIMNHYGRAHQQYILQEECAELIQAVSKIHRGTPNADEQFINELADVSIMVEQHISDFDEDELTEYYKKVNEKLERQQKRIEGGEM